MLRSRIAVSLLLLVGSIVVPVQKSVNVGQHNAGKNGVLLADGNPMPPPEPNPPGENRLVADGNPMPPPEPNPPGAQLA